MNNFPINDQPSKGPLWGTIIIVLIIIIGGIYIITSPRGDESEILMPPNGQPGEPGGPLSETDLQTFNSEAAIVDLNSMEADLNASESDLQNLDNELK